MSVLISPHPARVVGPRSGLHALRVRRMLYLGSAITAGTSLFWGVYFALRGGWLTVAIDAGTTLLAAWVAVLTRQGRQRAASRLLIGVLYVVLLANAALYDIPTLDVPRSAHQFLLALGVVSCLLTRDEPRWLRHGIPLLCLATYFGFAGTNAGWVTPMALPDTVRATGVWINHGIAVASVYAALHVIQSDVALREGAELQLRDAMLRGEFELHYQPQLHEDRGVIGAEALLRWRHPGRGMVPPGEFIPLAERTGLMVPLGEWVLRTACQQLAQWQRDRSFDGVAISVNVSATQLAEPDFVARVMAAVEHAGADPRRLKLELTESMLAHDMDDVVAKMTALKARGIGFSLDDFGTGFSSLSYLRRLPLDELKIDRSFVSHMRQSHKDAAIVELVVSLGNNLGLAVIAEGVETAEQRHFLRTLGCQAYQGYLYSRPVPPGEFASLVEKLRPTPQAACAAASAA